METMWLLAVVLMREGRLKEAEAMFAPSLAQAPTLPVDVAKFKWRLGQLRSLQGRHDEAMSLLREAQERFQKSGTPSQAAVALAALGSAQLAAGDAAAALATLQRSDTLLDKLHPNGSPDHADLLIDLARAQLALGHPREAAAAAAEAEEFWSRFDAHNRQAGLAQLWHARALLADGQGAAGFSDVEARVGGVVQGCGACGWDAAGTGPARVSGGLSGSMSPATGFGRFWRPISYVSSHPRTACEN